MQIDFNQLDADFNTRMKLVQEILSVTDAVEKDKMIDDMIAALQSGAYNNSVKATIVYLLGQLKARKALPVLIEFLNVSLIDFSEKSPSFKSEAARAILEIGPDSKEPLIQRLQATQDEVVGSQITAMLYQLTGSKKEVQDILKKAKEAAPEKMHLEKIQKKVIDWK